MTWWPGASQEIVKAGEEVAFLPTIAGRNPCTKGGSVQNDMPRSGEVSTVGRHYQHVAFTGPSAAVGPIIEGSDTDNMPRSGVAMGFGRTPPLAKTGELDAQARGG